MEVGQFATHMTTPKDAQRIFRTGRLKPSKSGWWGPGLYAYLPGAKRTEGKGDIPIYFDYSGLKITDGGKPEELSQAEWDRIRAKDSRVYNKMLERLGYDAQMDHKWIRVLPHALSKVTQIQSQQ
jgi:hypothetical protein